MNFCAMKIPNPMGFFCPTSGFTLRGGDLKMSLGMALPFFWPREVWMLFLCPSASIHDAVPGGSIAVRDVSVGKNIGKPTAINLHVTE